MIGPVISTIYNFLLTGVLVFAIACIYFLYLRKRDIAYILLGVMFGAYLTDNTVVFCTELIPSFAVFHDNMFVNTPSIKTVYFIMLVGCMLWAFSGHIIPKISVPSMVILLGFYAAVLICVPMISRNKWMVFFYYLPTQLFFMGISVWGLIKLRRKPVDQQLFSHADVKHILVFLLCMGAMILLEDILVIFFVDSFLSTAIKIHNRNLSENVLFLGLAVYIIRHACENLTLVVTAPPEPDRPGDDSARDPLKTFCLAHSLTEREQEVLQRVLAGKSQQEISDELIIALGTVKTHVHNIYQKTDASNRNQMIAKYQTFCHRLVHDPSAIESDRP